MPAVADIRAELMDTLETYLVPGTSTLAAIFPFRTLRTELASWGSLTLTRARTDKFMTELRYSLNISFTHDGSQSGLEAAELSLEAVTDDWRLLIKGIDGTVYLIGRGRLRD